MSRTAYEVRAFKPGYTALVHCPDLIAVDNLIETMAAPGRGYETIEVVEVTTERRTIRQLQPQ